MQASNILSLVHTLFLVSEFPDGKFQRPAWYSIFVLRRMRICRLQISYPLSVCSKKTMFKSTIESNTKQLMTTAYEDWLSTARKWMEDPIPIPPEPPQSCFSNGESQQAVDNDGPTHFSRYIFLYIYFDISHLLFPWSSFSHWIAALDKILGRVKFATTSWH